MRESSTEQRSCEDSGMQEIVVMQIGNIMPGINRENPNQGRVYDSNGLSPTLGMMQGGGQTTDDSRH